MLTPALAARLAAFRTLDLDENGQVAHPAPCRLYGYYLYNGAAAPRFVKLYDKATAPTHADTPALTIPLPAGAAANLTIPAGLPFPAGLAARATTAVADADTGAPAAHDVVANLFYA